MFCIVFYFLGSDKIKNGVILKPLNSAAIHCARVCGRHLKLYVCRMIAEPKRFIVRVYGIVFNQQGELLLSDELRFGQYMTKFVGGGLEFGEGVTDCLRREFREECGMEIEVGDLIYINEQFQESAFHVDGQLLSIYYGVKFNTHFSGVMQPPPKPWYEGAQYFRWKKPDQLTSIDLTWPIDRLVLARLKNSISGI
jgi:8-oxo-dGTP diphosphatase